MIQRIKEKKKINEVKKRSKINLTKGLKFRIDFEKENGEESCYYVFEPLLILKKKIMFSLTLRLHALMIQNLPKRKKLTLRTLKTLRFRKVI